MLALLALNGPQKIRSHQHVGNSFYFTIKRPYQ